MEQERQIASADGPFQFSRLIPSSNKRLVVQLQDHQQKDQETEHEDAHPPGVVPQPGTSLPYSGIERAKQVPQRECVGPCRLNLSDTGVWGRYCKLRPPPPAAPPPPPPPPPRTEPPGRELLMDNNRPCPARPSPTL